MVIEGVLAMTGQHFLLKYMEDHGLFPGFRKGFSLVERDEHRHIAFGVRFLKDMIEQEPRYGDLVLNKVLELVPHASHVFVPPYADSPQEFVSYGYRSERDLRLRLPLAEAAHGAARPGDPAGRRADAGADRLRRAAAAPEQAPTAA